MSDLPRVAPAQAVQLLGLLARQAVLGHGAHDGLLGQGLIGLLVAQDELVVLVAFMRTGCR